MLLNRAVGQEFTIRYDPRDPTFIWVYAEEDTLLKPHALNSLVSKKTTTKSLRREPVSKKDSRSRWQKREAMLMLSWGCRR